MAQRLALGQGADTLLDTIPEFVSNTLDGKYDNADGSYDTKNALLDIAKNQGVNLAFNLGAEGVAGLIKGVKALKGVNGEIDNAFKNFTIDQIKPTDSLADEARAIAKNERSNDLNYLMKQFNEKGHLLPGDSIADEAKALSQSAESNNLTSLMKQFNDTYGNDTAENVIKQTAQTTPEIPKLSDAEIDEILENPVIKEALEKTEGGAKNVAEAVSDTAKVEYPANKISSKDLDKQINSWVKMYGRGDDVDALKGELKSAMNEFESTGSAEAEKRIDDVLVELEKRMNGNSYTTQRSKAKNKSGRASGFTTYTYPTNYGTITDAVKYEVEGMKRTLSSNALNNPAMNEQLTKATSEMAKILPEDGWDSFNAFKVDIDNALKNPTEEAVDIVVDNATALMDNVPNSDKVVLGMLDDFSRALKSGNVDNATKTLAEDTKKATKVMAASVDSTKTIDDFDLPEIELNRPSSVADNIEDSMNLKVSKGRENTLQNSGINTKDELKNQYLEKGNFMYEEISEGRSL